MNTDGIFTCRPVASAWGLVLMLLLLGGMLAALGAFEEGGSEQPSDTAFAVGLGLLLCLGGIAVAVWAVRAQVRADAEGIRWRGMGRWRFAPWDQITDYYETFGQSGRQITTKLVVEFSGSPRKLNLGTKAWTCLDPLKQAVQERALEARTREWGLLGLRAVDPQRHIFHYDTKANRNDLKFAGFYLVLLVGGTLYLLLSAPASLPESFRVYGPALTLASILLFLTPWAGQSLLVWLILVPRVREWRRRRYEQIAIAPDRLAFESGGHRSQMEWDQVARLVKSRKMSVIEHRVELTDSASVTFTNQISEAPLVAQAMEDRSGLSWKTDHQEDRLRGSEYWTGGATGVGARVFTYRGRDARALLWLIWFVLGLMLLVPWLAQHMNEDVHSRVLLPPTLPWLAGCLYATWRYYAGRIWLDSTGIYGKSLRGVVSIPWGEVVLYGPAGSGFSDHLLVKGENASLRIHGLLPSIDDLQEEIKARAVNATEIRRSPL